MYVNTWLHFFPCLSQVLVVWDSGINKARNYRLFQEVSSYFAWTLIYSTEVFTKARFVLTKGFEQTSKSNQWKAKCYRILRKCYSSTFICQSRLNSFYFTLSFLHLQEQRVYLEADLTFPSLSALVEHYHINPLPTSNNSMPNYSFCLHLPFGYDLLRWHRSPVPCWNTHPLTAQVLDQTSADSATCWRTPPVTPERPVDWMPSLVWYTVNING